MSIKPSFKHENYSDEELSKSILSIFENNKLLALATSNSNRNHISTVFYSYDEFLQLYFISEPETEHIRLITTNLLVSAAIWTTPEIFGENLQGVQINGSCKKVEGLSLVSALKSYVTRFKPFGQLIKHPDDFNKSLTKSRLYKITPNKIKLLDEPSFGKRNYITLDC